MKKIYYLIFIIVILFACNKEIEDKETNIESNVELQCSCSPIVFLHPCNTFTEKEAIKLIPIIENKIKENTGLELYVQVLPKENIPKTLYNDKKTRYRAEKILKYFSNNENNENIILLHDDISTTKGNIPDWGIQGLANIPGNTCVASDYRVKDKSQFWKVIMHEFFHSYFSLRHCEKNNPTCLLREGPVRSSQKELCSDCKKKLFK